jgi:hypothetical protein
MADPIAFDIVQQADRRVASNGRATLSLLDAGGQVFRRRAVKGAGTADARRVEWVVAELDGVRVYFDGQHVVVSKQDLTP